MGLWDILHPAGNKYGSSGIATAVRRMSCGIWGLATTVVRQMGLWDMGISYSSPTDWFVGYGD
jgi:hypothetical protein